jgi:hypothetical protein
MGTSAFAYKLFFLLHITCAIVGFGSTFVWAAFGARSRSLEPNVAAAINESTLALSKRLSTPFIYATAFFGLGLVGLSDKIWKFDQTWISLALLLFVIGALLAGLVQVPTHKKMVTAQKELLVGGGDTAVLGADVEAAGKKMAMVGGILHLLLLLILIDMIWKPGL